MSDTEYVVLLKIYSEGDCLGEIPVIIKAASGAEAVRTVKALKIKKGLQKRQAYEKENGAVADNVEKKEKKDE